MIIGISTVIFWKDALGLTDFTKATFYKGIVLSILGQSSFVAAYCLLIIMARLTRFDGRRKRRPSILAPPIRRSSGMCCCPS